jgi:hypothetical protein
MNGVCLNIYGINLHGPGSLTLELGTGKPFGDIVQDGNNIYEESTRNPKLSDSSDSFFCNLDIGVVIRANLVIDGVVEPTRLVQIKGNEEHVY